MPVGHICYGMAVVAVEVNEPLFCDDFGVLGLNGLHVAFAEPTVDGVVGIACGGDEL